MSEFICGKVLCPFFKDIKTQKQKIICEGLDDDSVIMLVFNKKSKMDCYINKRCCNKYRECPIAGILYRKYNNNEN